MDNRKLKFVICELFNPSVHGYDETSSNDVLTHYISHYNYDYILFDIYSNDESTISNINKLIKLMKNEIKRYRLLFNHLSNHPIIRNYKNIIQNENYIKIEIAECLYLSGGECVAILKTFWLRIIQRTWKRIFKERTRIINLRCNPKNILYRSKYGKWSEDCLYLPDIKGMIKY